MRPSVLDASILLACLFKDGRARAVLLHASETAFLAPAAVVDETRRQLHRVANNAGLSAGELRALFTTLLDHVRILPTEALRPFERRARAIASAADAEQDWPYVALALAEGAPIWTYDKDFSRMRGVRCLSTAEVAGAPTGYP